MEERTKAYAGDALPVNPAAQADVKADARRQRGRDPVNQHGPRNFTTCQSWLLGGPKRLVAPLLPCFLAALSERIEGAEAKGWTVSVPV